MGMGCILVFATLLSSVSVTAVNDRLQLPSPKLDSEPLITTDDYDSSGCLASFQISENTIIRTQDSRTLGAKYLNESEFATKQQCLQWCCQTSDCNVAVYEEKNKGSCYIFDCGQSRNFKCKFTSHNHYTSATLKVNRHQYDLSKWGSETKHEEELSQLREKSFDHASVPPKATALTTLAYLSTTTTPSTTTTTLASSTVLPVLTSTVKLNTASSLEGNEEKSFGVIPDRRCSRFQFECRNTSECIAIYNACDGIPQCSDGSDESKELDCPTGNQRNILKTTESIGKLNTSGKWKTLQKQNINFDNVNEETNDWRQKAPVQGKKTQLHPAVEYPHRSSSHYSQQELQQQLEAQQNLQHPQQQQQHQQSQQPHQLQRQQIYRAKPKLDMQSSGTVFNHKTNVLIQNKDSLDYQQEKNYHRVPMEQNSYVEPYDENSKDDFSDMNYNQRLHPPPQSPPHYPVQDYEDGNDYWPDEREKHIGSLPSYEKSRLPSNDHSRGHETNMVQPYSHGQGINHGNHDSGLPSRIMKDNYEDESSYPSRSGYNFPKNLPEKGLSVPKPMMSPQTTYKNHPKTQNNRMGFSSQKKEYRDPGVTENSFPSLGDEPNHLNEPDQYPSSSIDQTESLSPVKENEAQVFPKKNQQLHKQKGNDRHSEHPPTTALEKLVPNNVNSRSQLNKVEVTVSEVELQKVERSNESSGAVLALTLGLSVTGILLVLVGCRVRMVRRHLRRGRSPYAHDADYLVNGMYL